MLAEIATRKDGEDIRLSMSFQRPGGGIRFGVDPRQFVKGEFVFVCCIVTNHHFFKGIKWAVTFVMRGMQKGFVAVSLLSGDFCMYVLYVYDCGKVKVLVCI